MANSELNIRLENVTPILSVSDMDRSVAFYVDILGFRNADWGSDVFTYVSRDNTGLYLSKGAQGSPGTWVWIGFDGDILALHEQLKSRGARITLPPTNYSWAYELHSEDPDGHTLRFGTEPNDNLPFADR